MTASAHETILRIEHLTKHFPLEGGKVLTACDDVTFPVYRGDILGIVGESGCGKSTLVRTLMQLHPPSEGKIFFKDQEITGLKGEDARNIKDIICEPLRNFGLLEGSARDKAAELLCLVDLPEEFAERYPANMSGGQRQRVGIARALALEPEILVCDEATSALDVSVQETIVELLVRIQRERNLTILFICHDLALVSRLCTRVVVMYFGKVVEALDGKDLAQAKHPYTQKLLKSVFTLLPKGKAPRIEVPEMEMPDQVTNAG